MRFRYGLVTRSPSRGWLCQRASEILVSLLSAAQATEVLALPPVGLTPTERVRVSLDALPDIEFSPVRLKADVPGGQPSPSHSSPACTRAGHGLRWPSGAIDYRPLSRRGHSPANAGHSRRLSPSRSPRRPGALRSSGLLSPASLLLRPHVPVSCPPAHFPPCGYSAGLTGKRPSPF